MNLQTKQFFEFLVKEKIVAQYPENATIFEMTEQKIISAETLAKALSCFFELPIVQLNHIDSQKLPMNAVPISVIQQKRILPIKQNRDTITIAMTDPSDTETIQKIQFETHKIVHAVIAPYDQMQMIIDTLLMEHHAQSASQVNNEIHHNQKEPVIAFIDTLIEEAIRKKISDIHFETSPTHCRIRFRKNGVLYLAAQTSSVIAQQLSARIKIMSQLNIAEKRLPQDGHFKFETLKEITDVRTSICPTQHGEKIVLRLQNQTQLSLNIDELGFTAVQKKQFVTAITKPQGLVLVTGPTGSGKTVTLYAALKHLNNIEKNILTIEDPIEIDLPGINQLNINPKIGLTFPAALRAFLRQDPDIIMIGEIRDLETAKIAITAAQTGHLVLSTLHTNSVFETLQRLTHMGISHYDLIGSLSLITAQRLIRLLCPHCKQPHPLEATLKQQLKFLENSQLFEAAHCSQCQTGYTHRTAIHECLPITQELYELMAQKNNYNAMRYHAKQHKISTLQERSLELIANGSTSIEEIRRVIGL